LTKSIGRDSQAW